MKKEIYFVESQYNPHGASTNRLFAFALYLLKNGVTPHFFYLFPDKNKSKSHRYTDEFEFHYLWDKLPFTNKYLCTLISVLKFRKQIKTDIPIYVYSLINCLFFIRINQKTKVFHECTENPNYDGKIQNFVGNLLFALYKKAVKECSGLFVITPSLKQFFIDTTGINPNNVEVLNMIVDPHRFDGLDNTLPSDRISYCGTISEKKDGISYLLKSFSLISSDFPTYKLYVIGKFENEVTKKNVIDYIEKQRLSERVILTGPVSPDKMPSLLKQSKVLALARPMQKEKAFGFATKVGEYLMTERPVVMTDVGNVGDYLEDGKNVILARPNDEVDFANKLRWAIENEEASNIIGQNGRNAALHFFNSEIEGEKIYKKIFYDI